MSTSSSATMSTRKTFESDAGSLRQVWSLPASVCTSSAAAMSPRICSARASKSARCCAVLLWTVRSCMAKATSHKSPCFHRSQRAEPRDIGCSKDPTSRTTISATGSGSSKPSPSLDCRNCSCVLLAEDVGFSIISGGDVSSSLSSTRTYEDLPPKRQRRRFSAHGIALPRTVDSREDVGFRELKGQSRWGGRTAPLK